MAQSQVTTKQVCALMNTARVQVVAYLPALESKALAECFRSAAVDYRRKVLLITVPYFAQSKDSFTGSLALAGVKVFEANVNSAQGVILIDGVSFSADQLGTGDHLPLDVQDAAHTRAIAGWFNRTLHTAQVLTPVRALQRLGGTP